MADEQMDRAQDRLAKIIFDGIVDIMPQKMRQKFVGHTRAPWRREDTMEAAKAALPDLLQCIDMAWVLTATAEDIREIKNKEAVQ